MEMKLELVPVPVADVDRAKAFYVEQGGFHADLMFGRVTPREWSNSSCQGRCILEPGEARRPTLTWPRQLPVDGEPADVTEIVTAYGEWLSRSDVPKLYSGRSRQVTTESA